MAKKKTQKTKAEKPAVNLSEALGIDKILNNERLKFFVGLLLFIVAI